MRLAEFIEDYEKDIVAEAVSFARTLTPLSESEEKFIRNHIPGVLQAIVADLRIEQSRKTSIDKSRGLLVCPTQHTDAGDHGLQRARAGLSIEQVLAEYRALRSSVLRLWTDASLPAPEDVRDIGRFNEAIDQAVAESVREYAAETERRRQYFLAALGHDLRGPLNAVAIASEAIRIQGHPKLETFSNVLSKGVSRMSALLKSLLDYNLVGLGTHMSLTKAVVDLAEECRSEVEIVAAANPHSHIQFKATGDCAGSFDESRVREAFSNLVTNAVKHGDESSVISVEVEGTQKAVHLTVSNGIDAKIPDAELAMLFEPTRRISTAKVAPERASLGLGLFIAKEIAIAHGGTIEATCTDKSISFAITLPKA